MENNNNGFERFKNVMKSFAKGLVKRLIMFLLPILLILALLFGFVYVITKQDGSRKEGDIANAPYAASTYTSSVTIDEEGNITTNMTAQALWDEMIKNNSRVEVYLDGPEDLLKLMNAELITNYPDTRPNPDEEIDWETINKDVTSNKVQGIIKFRRADNDGTVKTLSYMPPSQFDLYMREYNTTGSAEARDQILSHFTLKKGNAGIAGSINYNGPDLCWPVEPHFVTVTSQFGYRGSVGVAGATAKHGAIDIGDVGIEGTPAYA